ncbi:carbohydrate ABC transporter permease [Vallitalea okinawensis]|uniref:carbohydrate ABC transporter permease n=1 Tax=Vallitalea okinawensis TaxID=2078660 RepID=UPI000CFDA8EA|nr:carbohydrate ABC transporter permease [Vallitalea okinawensis]
MKTSTSYKIFNVVNNVFFVFLAFIMLFPLLNVLCLSLEPEYIASEVGTIHLIPKAITFKAYAAIWENDMIKSAFFNTAFVSAVASGLGVILTAMLGYGFSNEDTPYIKVFSFLVLFAMMFSGGLIPSYLLIKNLGLIDSLWALIIPSLITPGNVILMRAFFMSIPKSLSESAMLDGCTEVGVFFKIVLPLSMPIIATIILFYAVTHWNTYLDAVIYINDNSKKTLQVVLREILFETQGDDASAEAEGLIELGTNIKMATVIVAIVPILCVYPFLQKHFTKGILLGAVKG